MTQREKDQQWVVELGDGVYVHDMHETRTRNINDAYGWRRKADAEAHAREYGTIASVRRRKPNSHPNGRNQ